MLVDPTGQILQRPSAKRTVTLTNPKLAVIAANAEEAFQLMHLTVVCVHCGGTPIGRNALTDGTWKLECGCTVRTMDNPKPQRLIGVN
jgi:hypothetical protein